MKFALESFSAFQAMAIRVGVPAMFYMFTWTKWRNFRMKKGDWKFLVFLTACELCLFFFCVTNAMLYTSASEAGIMAACLPLVTAAGAWLFLIERMNFRSIGGMLVALCGIGGLNIFSVKSGMAQIRFWEIR